VKVNISAAIHATAVVIGAPVAVWLYFHVPVARAVLDFVIWVVLGAALVIAIAGMWLTIYLCAAGKE
jgi:ABC-type amino acid transport system permease subunit